MKRQKKLIEDEKDDLNIDGELEGAAQKEEAEDEEVVSPS